MGKVTGDWWDDSVVTFNYLNFRCRMTETMTSRFPNTAETIMKHIITAFTMKNICEGVAALARDINDPGLPAPVVPKAPEPPPLLPPPNSSWNVNSTLPFGPVDCVEIAASD